MKTLPSAILLSLLMVGLVGCDSNRQPESSPAAGTNPATTLPPADQAPTPLGEGSDATPDTTATAESPGATAGPPAPLSLYSLKAVLDYEAHFLAAEEQIAYFNNSGETLSDLLLVVEPNRFPGAFDLKALSWKDGSAIAEYGLEGAQLRIPLAEPLPPGGRIDLSISFDSNLPARDAPYGFTERQTNLGDWYPFIPPYTNGEGWLVRPPAGQGEHLAYDSADFMVDFQLASPNTSGGQSLIIAASARPEGDGKIYRLQAARSFAISVSPLYQVRETKVGGVTLSSYTFPYHVAADQPALEESAKALATFSQIFGPYPHDSLSVVEADFLNGMEYDGLIFLSHAFYDYYTGDQKSNLTLISAHEVAHQWWYGLVGNDQAREPWLDEALSTYSESLFYEQAYPQMESWWWENRVAFHQPQGWVDSPIDQFGPQDFYPYRNAVYLRGAMFLEEVRQAMGDEAFFAFLRDYVSKYSHQQARGEDFFSLMKAHSNADLEAIIGAYFANP